MKKILIAFLCLFAFPFCHAQSIERYAIGTAGGFINQGPTSLSFTVGQTLTATVNVLNNILTQGFQQPVDILSAVYEFDNNDGQIKVYPNPATEIIHVSIQNKTIKNFQLQVYNLVGENVQNKFTVKSNEEIILNISSLPAGIYFIRVTENQFTRVIRFIKSGN